MSVCDRRRLRVPNIDMAEEKLFNNLFERSLGVIDDELRLEYMKIVYFLGINIVKYNTN